MYGQVTSLSYKRHSALLPLSPTCLYFRQVEVLGKAITTNSSIKGITINNAEIRLSQYADDTILGPVVWVWKPVCLDGR